MKHLLTYFNELKNSQELSNFLETTILEKEQWQVVKSIYKKLEQERITSALVAVIANLDKAKLEERKKEKHPSAATLGYMKRRAARFLRQLAKEDEALYVKICLHLFKKQLNPINWNNQWVLANILLGNSTRFVHSRHGRGKVVQLKQHNIYRTEEKSPDIWNKYLNEVANLLQTEGLAWEVYDFAAKVLARNQRQIFGFSLLQVERFYESSSPWLWSIAVRECFEAIERGLMQNVKLMAYTYFYTNSIHKKQLWEAFQQIEETKQENLASSASFFLKLVNYLKNDMTTKQANAWVKQFVEQLAQLAFSHLKDGIISRRVVEAIRFLKNYVEIIPTSLIQAYLPVLLQSQHPELEELVFNKAAFSKIEEVENWLLQLEESSLEQRTRLFKLFKDKFSQKSHQSIFYKYNWLENWIYHEKAIVADFAWYVASHNYNISQKLIHKVMSNVSWWSVKQSIVLDNLLSSTYGSELALQYAQRHFKNWLYYKDSFLYVYKRARGKLKAWLRDLMTREAQKHLFGWIFTIAGLEDRDKIWEKTKPNINFNNINIRALYQLLIHPNQWINDKGWHVLTYKNLNTDNCEYLLNAIVVRGSEQQAQHFLQQILKLDNEALKIRFIDLIKKGLTMDKRLMSRLLPIFKEVLPQLNLDALLAFCQTLNDQQWINFKSAIRENILDKDISSFWQKALQLIAESNDEVLFNRLIRDTQLQKTFFEIRSIDILEVKHPIFAPLLGQWVRHNEALFQPNSAALLKACVHPLPAVRNWALGRAATFSSKATFALQLMETGVPDAVTLGKDFFLKLPKGDANELEYLLMLCDSPKQEVRAFGMHLFKQKQEHLHAYEALESLSEHPDSYIQAFVAKQITTSKTADKAYVQQFDKAVLRIKNRSRKAKELVKKRIEQQDFTTSSPKQTQSLLELARSNNKLDAEWAIQQLTKLALAGEETELSLMEH